MTTEYKHYSDDDGGADRVVHDTKAPDLLVKAKPPDHDQSNLFMHEVHQKRKLSLSYSKLEDSDSEEEAPFTIDSDREYKHDHNNNPYLSPRAHAFIPPPPTALFAGSFGSSASSSEFAKHAFGQPHRKSTDRDSLLGTRAAHLRLERRHSADKILIKPSRRNVNSSDYQHRMIIALRAKIATYKEDLRIAGELGQNLYSANLRKEKQIDEFKQENRRLRMVNEEISMRQSQLLQSSQLDAEMTNRLKQDLQRQQTSHIDTRTQYEEENIVLRERLQQAMNEIRGLNQLREQQQLEIEKLELRNEQISQNAGETIDDLSRELAEEKDGHSVFKHKYQQLRNEFTKLKINFEKRGTEIEKLCKQMQVASGASLSNVLQGGTAGDLDMANANSHNADSHHKQQVQLLLRRVDSCKDEMQGMSQHLSYCKSQLHKSNECLEQVALTQDSTRFTPQTVYKLCKATRLFLGDDTDPPMPQAKNAVRPDDNEEDDEEEEEEEEEEQEVEIPPPPAAETKVSAVMLAAPPRPRTPKLSSASTPATPPSSTKPQIPLPRPQTPKHNAVKVHKTMAAPPPVPATKLSLPPPAVPAHVETVAPILPAPPSNEPHTEVRSIQHSALHAPPLQTTFESESQSRRDIPPPSAAVAATLNLCPPPPPLMSSPPQAAPKNEFVDVRSGVVQRPHGTSTSAQTQRTVVHSTATVPVVQHATANAPCLPALPALHTFEFAEPPSHMISPQERAQIKVAAQAMAPPSLPRLLPPSLMPAAPTSVDSVLQMPMPVEEEEKEVAILESVMSGASTLNEQQPKPPAPPKKPRKKTTKSKKKQDSMEEQRHHLTMFFSTYSNNKRWEEGEKAEGVQKYVLKFADREPLHARMAFLYSMTLYLGQIVGVNKRCITHAFMLFKSVRAQIDTLCEEFSLILQTLEHHNDDKLWKYVYSFLYNAAAYFKHIQKFVGKRIEVGHSRQYHRALKAGSKDFGHRESSFRRLSGLSEVSGQSVADAYQASHDVKHAAADAAVDRNVYGVAAAADDRTNNTDTVSALPTNKLRKSNKKKKKSSYA